MFLWGLGECLHSLYLCPFVEVREQQVWASLGWYVLYHFGQFCLITTSLSGSRLVTQHWFVMCNLQPALLHSAHWKLLIICHKKCSLKQKC